MPMFQIFSCESELQQQIPQPQCRSQSHMHMFSRSGLTGGPADRLQLWEFSQIMSVSECFRHATMLVHMSQNTHANPTFLDLFTHTKMNNPQEPNMSKYCLWLVNIRDL